MDIRAGEQDDFDKQQICLSGMVDKGGQTAASAMTSANTSMMDNHSPNFTPNLSFGHQ